VDLSGTLQGAGGVGGLLSTELKTPAMVCYPAYDGNGNISAWVNGNGDAIERRDYSPFGRQITVHQFVEQTVLDKLRFGFSTKYEDFESGLLYYCHRYYDAFSGRWLNRDPIGERGGVNLMAFVRNDPLNRWDYLGWEEQKKCTVKMEISGAPEKDSYYLMRSYPWAGPRIDLDKDGVQEIDEPFEYYYMMPYYKMVVTGVNKEGEKQSMDFRVLRFSVAWNPRLNGKLADAKSKARPSPVVTGLADAQDRTAVYMRDYIVHNTETPENSAFQIWGSHLLHDGPDYEMGNGWGASGCVEVGGIQGFTELKNFVSLYALAGETREERLKELSDRKAIRIILEKAERPTIKDVRVNGDMVIPDRW
jgi:RHS repeat-associated protein